MVGSLAAGAQAAVGNVAAKGLFSVVQGAVISSASAALVERVVVETVAAAALVEKVVGETVAAAALGAKFLGFHEGKKMECKQEPEIVVCGPQGKGLESRVECSYRSGPIVC